MKKRVLTLLIASAALAITACSTNAETQTTAAPTETTVADSSQETSQNESSSMAKEASSTVTITDASGEVEVRVNPSKVVALDNRTFQTLEDWGIEVLAVPKGIMPADSKYVLDETIQDIGNHGEPNLEIIAAVDPELVIVGQRFAKYYDDIKTLVPNADVINLNIDVSEEAGTPGENLVNGLKNSTTALGMIFEKEAEADELNAEFDKAIADAKAAYNTEKKILSVIVSGGEIGFSAPGSGRVYGPWYEVLGLTPALVVEGSTSNHQGDEVSVEAIAQSNPDYLFVLDRDSAVSAEGGTPAKDVIENSEALKQVNAIMNQAISYAPADTYVNESIQTHIEILNSMKEIFSK